MFDALVSRFAQVDLLLPAPLHSVQKFLIFGHAELAILPPCAARTHRAVGASCGVVVVAVGLAVLARIFVPAKCASLRANVAVFCAIVAEALQWVVTVASRGLLKIGCGRFNAVLSALPHLP